MTALPALKMKNIKAPDCAAPKRIPPLQKTTKKTHTQKKKKERKANKKAKKSTSTTLDCVVQKSTDNFCGEVESDQVRKRQGEKTKSFSAVHWKCF